MPIFQKIRAVGNFDVLSAPLNSLGIFDAEKFKADISKLLQNENPKIGLDLSGLSIVYSDAFNAFFEILTIVSAKDGEFVLIVDDIKLEALLSKNGISGKITVFSSEMQLLNYSIRSTLSDATQTMLDIQKVREDKKKTFSGTENLPVESDELFEDEPATKFWLFCILGFLTLGCVVLFLLLR